MGGCFVLQECIVSMLFVGGESQRVIFSVFSGYSKSAQCTGKPSYLESISGSIQKPIEDRSALSLCTLFKREGVAVLSTSSHNPESNTQNYNQAFLATQPCRTLHLFNLKHPYNSKDDPLCLYAIFPRQKSKNK